MYGEGERKDWHSIIVVDQLNQILYVLGTPDDDTLNRIGSERVSNWIGKGYIGRKKLRKLNRPKHI